MYSLQHMLLASSQMRHLSKFTSQNTGSSSKIRVYPVFEGGGIRSGRPQRTWFCAQLHGSVTSGHSSEMKLCSGRLISSFSPREHWGSLPLLLGLRRG
jgi:hypothetical protein